MTRTKNWHIIQAGDIRTHNKKGKWESSCTFNNGCLVTYQVKRRWSIKGKIRLYDTVSKQK